LKTNTSNIPKSNPIAIGKINLFLFEIFSCQKLGSFAFDWRNKKGIPSSRNNILVYSQMRRDLKSEKKAFPMYIPTAEINRKDR
jgi:hypothetical protein